MEAEIRLGAFLAMFVMMAFLEVVLPKRIQDPKRLHRWSTNVGLAALSTLLVRISVGGIVYSVAMWASVNDLGILNFISPPLWLHALMTIFILDVLIYWQHVFSHKLPILWRMHQVHHTDQFLDTTSGVRFHPFEIFFSLVVKVIAVIVIGADPMSVIIFEVILNVCAVFNHANVALPLTFDRVLRKFIVTPDMHRVHHSVIPKETDSNFGFFLSIWDRLFSSYCDQPKAGHEKMTIGLSYAQTEKSVRFDQLLMMPLRSRS